MCLIIVIHLLFLPIKHIYFSSFFPHYLSPIHFFLKEWKGSVESVRTKLHISFSKYMEKLQYKGEIQLRMKDTFMDWGTYRLCPSVYLCPCLCLCLCLSLSLPLPLTLTLSLFVCAAIFSSYISYPCSLFLICFCRCLFCTTSIFTLFLSILCP